ncbi:hypothetical protein TcCL_ESM00579, partial [Trypanosoma cruzi]
RASATAIAPLSPRPAPAKEKIAEATVPTSSLPSPPRSTSTRRMMERTRSSPCASPCRRSPASSKSANAVSKSAGCSRPIAGFCATLAKVCAPGPRPRSYKIQRKDGNFLVQIAARARSTRKGWPLKRHTKAHTHTHTQDLGAQCVCQINLVKKREKKRRPPHRGNINEDGVRWRRVGKRSRNGILIAENSRQTPS